jgi:hypothetical protein
VAPFRALPGPTVAAANIGAAHVSDRTVAAAATARPPGRRAPELAVATPRTARSEAPREAAVRAPSDRVFDVGELPAGITCVVRGTGAPFDTSCSGSSVLVENARAGGRIVSRVYLRHLDVAWGFYGSKGRAWIAAESGGLEVRAFADAQAERFRLDRRVTAFPGHVWLTADAPVHVLGGVDHGVRVSLADDLAGTEALPASVECDTVRYDPAPRRTANADDDDERPDAHDFALARGPRLPIRFGPRAPVVAVLGTDADPFRSSLGILERHGGFTRVRFETDHALFDVWADDRSLSFDPGGIGGTGGRGICGGSRDNMLRTGRTVARDTDVLVGTTPRSNDTTGVRIVEGTRVRVLDARPGFFAVEPFASEIQPPEGERFWVPESALE